MDIAAARAALPGITRAALGELIAIRPMREGKMKQSPDDSRPVLLDVPARVDIWPDLVQMGGGREKPTVSLAQGEHATASIVRRAGDWEPRQGDHVLRGAAKGAGLFRITRTGEDGDGRMMLYLSAAAS